MEFKILHDRYNVPRNLNANKYMNITNSVAFLTAVDCGGNEKQHVPCQSKTRISVIKHVESNCTLSNLYEDRWPEEKEDGSKHVD